MDVVAPIFGSAGPATDGVDLDDIFADFFFTFDGQFTDGGLELEPEGPGVKEEQVPAAAEGATAAAAAAAAVEAVQPPGISRIGSINGFGAGAATGLAAPAASAATAVAATAAAAAAAKLAAESAETRKRKAFLPLGMMSDRRTDRMSEKQKIERRQERNREHAKRSRIRKKFLLECLQEQLMLLRKENMNLRQVVKERMPTVATQVFEKCINEKALVLSGKQVEEAASALAGMEAAERRREQRLLVEPDFQLIQCLMDSQQNFTVSDPALPDNPIVYASQGFLKLTGYTMDKVIGRNCRFLQGPGTDQRAVDIIRRGIADGRDTSVCLLNYQADGTPFWNQFFIAALRDAAGKVVNFVGVQCEVKELTLAEWTQRLKKLPLPEELMHDEDDNDD